MKLTGETEIRFRWIDKQGKVHVGRFRLANAAKLAMADIMAQVDQKAQEKGGKRVGGISIREPSQQSSTI